MLVYFKVSQITTDQESMNRWICLCLYLFFNLINVSIKLFVTYDEKESLMLSIANSNQKIVVNTHSKPRETLEFEMTKQKEYSSFNIPLEVPEKKMME